MRKKFSSFFVWCKMQCFKKNANQDARQKPVKNFNTLLEPFPILTPFAPHYNSPKAFFKLYLAIFLRYYDFNCFHQLKSNYFLPKQDLMKLK